jgi:hypothetical protein
LYAVPEQALLTTEATKLGNGLMVTVTWSWADVHGPFGSLVVKVNVTEPAEISAALGV